MRLFHEIDLETQGVTTRELQGEEIVNSGRYLIAKTLLERGAAEVDPLGPDNPLIFSVGPFAGTAFSNANRTSVGCKSPLTGGVKEANGGGSFGYALGQLGVAGLTLSGACAEWSVMRLHRDGRVAFEDAAAYVGRGNFEVARQLFETYGKKVALALCGPVGEYQGLLAGVAFTDKDGRPARVAARGGVGAVMGAKRVKAIVVDLDRPPPFSDTKKVNQAVRAYGQMVQNDEIIQTSYRPIGTMGMADVQNYLGGLPVRNFSVGRLADTEAGEEFRMGGDYIIPQVTARGGEPTHSCMPGCLIQCSNVYVDAEGHEIVSPVEYETLGLLGSNCGLTDPDDLARLNETANDLGIDTIETGAMLAVLMEAGEAEFGDTAFMHACLDEIRQGSERGRLLAQGTARVGKAFGVQRVPVIKQQAISAYDPRVVEATGVAMMSTAQGADHTAGNLPRLVTQEMSVSEIISQSLAHQTRVAAVDSLGLCVFGGSVTYANLGFLADAINAAHGTDLDEGFFERLGRGALVQEHEFNRRAGFEASDDELPAFFYEESLPPTGRVARIRGADVHDMYNGLPAVGGEGA
ncbi:MAG: aldehyde:ferredoxin oxidoreductase [Chloroflexi bacterium]|nr:MAG: aldehyde:ferredoxin oxidoreductase [Chloroflexota bacterium]